MRDYSLDGCCSCTRTFRRKRSGYARLEKSSRDQRTLGGPVPLFAHAQETVKRWNCSIETSVKRMVQGEWICIPCWPPLQSTCFGFARMVNLIPEEAEDVWHAYNLVAVGDSVRSTTIRWLYKLILLSGMHLNRQLFWNNILFAFCLPKFSIN